MKNVALGTLYHNRCVVITKEHIALAGLTIGDPVVMRAVGGAVTIRGARVIEKEPDPVQRLQGFLQAIEDMTPEQVSVLLDAMAERLE